LFLYLHTSISLLLKIKNTEIQLTNFIYLKPRHKNTKENTIEGKQKRINDKKIKNEKKKKKKKKKIKMKKSD